MSPHFFVFNEKRQPVYTGCGVNNPRNANKATANDPDKALNELADIGLFCKSYLL